MRIVACDDDVSELEELKQQLQEIGGKYQLPLDIRTFTEGEQCCEYLLLNSADIVFMDIYLKPGNGVELVRRLRQQRLNFKLVFLTSSNDFAIESYEVEAAYYLLKPLQPEKLEQALKRCGAFDKEEYVTFDTAVETVKLKPKDIIVVEVQDKYCYIHTAQRTYKVYSSINKVREKLTQDYFLLTYRSVLINMHYVEGVYSNYFLLGNGFKAPIRVRDSAAVRNAYMKWALLQD